MHTYILVCFQRWAAFHSFLLTKILTAQSLRTVFRKVNALGFFPLFF